MASIRSAALLASLASATIVLALPATASAHEEIFYAILTGPAEAPPNSSPGNGFAVVTWDLDLVTMRVEVFFADLIGTTTASHIHGPTVIPGAGTAGVATMLPSFVGFPLGVHSGSYDHTFDMTVASSYNPSFISSSGGTVSQALNRLLQSARDGTSYLNIHTSAFPGGEIRGFLQAPAPSAMAILGLGGLVAARRRR